MSNQQEVVAKSLYRLTEGIPRMELKAIASEAKQCEALLQQELELLQQALKKEQQQQGEQQSSSNNKLTEENDAAVNGMLESEFTPPDSCFAVSALLGRLRDELATPLPPNSTIPAHRAKTGLATTTTKTTSNNNASSTNPPPAKKKKTGEVRFGFSELHQLEQYPWYRKEHETHSSLLSLWKRIANHRSSAVFRRPVNPKEAPGYTDRITFPMDLSLIRKLIVSRMVTSYAELRAQVGLICHDCLKYNGRESDYGVVAREFEAVVDDMITAAVMARSVHKEPSASSSSRPSSSMSAAEPKSSTTASAANDKSTSASASTNKSAPATAPSTTPASAINSKDAANPASQETDTGKAPPAATK